MRATEFLIATQKETPADAEVISHQLMLRAGLIRKLASGLYTWLPLGLKVLRRVESIVREEMNRAGAQEVLMPIVQPSELWEESGRWQQYGSELLRIEDRHQRPFCLGPTHEEVITDLIRNELNSYRQLPASFYQIQTKFRDEVRPRFGVMRAREFLMKDAYSFHSSQACLQKTYDAMHDAYTRIFTRIGLDFRAVLADTGSIGGSASHEFHVLAQSGEDDIAFSTESHYAANIELAEAVALPCDEQVITTATEVATPEQKTIEDVANALNVPSSKTLKTLVITVDKEESDAHLVALVLRGDHTLNEIKVANLLNIDTVSFAEENDIEAAFGAKTGSLGPLGLSIDVIVDRSAATLKNFVCGANKTGYHSKDANWHDTLTQSNCRVADIRNVAIGDPSPDGQGHLEIRRGIEVGHIFQLGSKYSEAMNATALGENGKAQTLIMGCYGIGVSRVVASAIEQNHDDNGIIWPEAIAPFHIALIPINKHKSEQVESTCEALYKELTAQGYEVLYMNEHKARLGVMLADTELMGIPHRIVVGDRGLEKQKIEYKGRRDEKSQDIDLDNLNTWLSQNINLSLT